MTTTQPNPDESVTTHAAEREAPPGVLPERWAAEQAVGGKLSEVWKEEPGDQGLPHHGEPQAHRPPLPVHRGDLLRDRRRSGGRDAHPARHARQHPDQPRALQPAVLAARHRDDLLLRHADEQRVRQLLPAADGRHPRHGVPPAERAELLDLPVLRHLHVLQPAARDGARRRLVRLRAADPRPRRARPGLLHARPAVPGRLEHGRRDQPDRHGAEDAGARACR